MKRDTKKKNIASSFGGGFIVVIKKPERVF